MSTGNLVIANGDATGSADKLGIAIDSTASSINSGSLHLQTVSESTRLDSLNGGRGVALGSFLVRDSTGLAHSIKVDVLGTDTIGDIINQINAAPIGVIAKWLSEFDAERRLEGDHFMVSAAFGF